MNKEMGVESEEERRMGIVTLSAFIWIVDCHGRGIKPGGLWDSNGALIIVTEIKILPPIIVSRIHLSGCR